MNKIFVNADGGSRGNPGPAAIGIVIWDKNHNLIKSHKERIGVATNNVAEYKALVKALSLASRHTKEEVHIIMDSELVIRQMKGEYRIKAKHLLPLFQEAKDLESRFRRVTYSSVSRQDTYQSKADALVNEALDSDICRNL